MGIKLRWNLNGCRRFCSSLSKKVNIYRSWWCWTYRSKWKTNIRGGNITCVMSSSAADERWAYLYVLLLLLTACSSSVGLLTSEASVNIFILWKQASSSCLHAVFFWSLWEPCVPTVYDMDTQWRIPLELTLSFPAGPYSWSLSCLHTELRSQTLVVFTWRVISYRAHSWKGLCRNFNWAVKGTLIVPPHILNIFFYNVYYRDLDASVQAQRKWSED